MAWIEYSESPDLSDAVRARLARWKVAWAQMDNVLRIHGVNPPVIDGHFDLYESVLRRPSPLTRLQRELIGTVVSSINRCEY